MVIKSTFRVELLYSALSLLVVNHVYKDSNSMWVAIGFFVVLGVMGIVYPYIFRVNAVEINENYVAFRKVGRSVYIEKGGVRRISRMSHGYGVFHVWFTDGTEHTFIPILAYKNKDLIEIEKHLKRMQDTG